MTPEEASAYCKANPGACVRPPGARTLTYRWDKVEGWLGYFHGSWSSCNNHPDAEPEPWLAYAAYEPCQNPSKPKDEPKPFVRFPPSDESEFWESDDGYVYRLTPYPSTTLFQYWVPTNGVWREMHTPGRPPFKPCPDPSKPKIEPKAGAELRAWMVANPEREVRIVEGADYPMHWYWSSCVHLFMVKDTPCGEARACRGPTAPMVPADGKPW